MVARKRCRTAKANEPDIRMVISDCVTHLLLYDEIPPMFTREVLAKVLHRLFVAREQPDAIETMVALTLHPKMAHQLIESDAVATACQSLVHADANAFASPSVLAFIVRLVHTSTFRAADVSPVVPRAVSAVLLRSTDETTCVCALRVLCRLVSDATFWSRTTNDVEESATIASALVRFLRVSGDAAELRKALRACRQLACVRNERTQQVVCAAGVVQAVVHVATRATHAALTRAAAEAMHVLLSHAEHQATFLQGEDGWRWLVATVATGDAHARAEAMGALAHFWVLHQSLTPAVVGAAVAMVMARGHASLPTTLALRLLSHYRHLESVADRVNRWEFQTRMLELLRSTPHANRHLVRYVCRCASPATAMAHAMLDAVERIHDEEVVEACQATSIEAMRTLASWVEHESSDGEVTALLRRRSDALVRFVRTPQPQTDAAACAWRLLWLCLPPHARGVDASLVAHALCALFTSDNARVVHHARTFVARVSRVFDTGFDASDRLDFWGMHGEQTRLGANLESMSRRVATDVEVRDERDVAVARVPRELLAARAPYFSFLCDGRWSDSATPCVRLAASRHVVVAVVEYVSRGLTRTLARAIETNVDLARELAVAADRYALDGLLHRIEWVLVRQMQANAHNKTINLLTTGNVHAPILATYCAVAAAAATDTSNPHTSRHSCAEGSR